MSNKLGLGTMGMDFSNRDSSIKTIHKALDEGINIFNTGDFYRQGQSQVILGEALKDIPRDKYFVSLKFGVTFSKDGASLDVRPENIKKHLLDSLAKMNLDYVDLYQPARMDTEIPVEDVVREIKSLIDEGYVRHIGLSEVDADTLKRAYKIHPIHSVEVEYSLLNREIEQELIKTAKELGVQVVVYGAVGHGILTDKVLSGNNPMLNRSILNDNVKDHNLAILNKFKDIAGNIGLTNNELAIAWTQSKYDNITTLIGTTSSDHLMSAIKAINTKLDDNDIKLIEETVSMDTIKGTVMRKWIFTNGVGRMV